MSRQLLPQGILISVMAGVFLVGLRGFAVAFVSHTSTHGLEGRLSDLSTGYSPTTGRNRMSHWAKGAFSTSKFEDEASGPSSAALCASLAGVALACVARANSRRPVRTVDVCMNVVSSAGKRFSWMDYKEETKEYKEKWGEDKATRKRPPPRWLHLEEPPDGSEKQRNRFGIQRPMWLTLEKWQQMRWQDQFRGMRHYHMYFDEKGNRVPIGRKAPLFTFAQAIDQMLEWHVKYPGGLDPGIELQITLNMDLKKPDHQIRTFLQLPHAAKKRRVAVFCTPDEEEEALANGAHVAGQTLAEMLNKEKFDFDVLITKPANMASIARLGKLLGPKGLMPSPKLGTVVADVKEGIEAWSSGTRLVLRNNFERQVLCSFGKASLGREKLIENCMAIMTHLANTLPPKCPKDWFRKVMVKATHSRAVRIAKKELPQIEVEEEESEVVIQRQTRKEKKLLAKRRRQ
eukprot:TRINITY_DN49091_c0_g1_i1.p1 TRINITY_DN49091_c0_g1~~TRINITY_DN49091_c0_g1_i1.p1  ORF type:complete len:459 (-),score=84.48 TRINITY_DN49091_c0_g1_i1:338-1714(-)